MRLSDLQTKEIISVDGKKLGIIIDVIVETNGRIVSLVVEEKIRRFRNSNEEKIVKWNNILRIGTDVILVDLTKN